MNNADYIDICQAPIHRGDLVEYYDAGNREVYVFKVLELEQETEKSRVFRVSVVKSTGTLKIGDTHSITLPKFEETKGYVYRENTENGKTTYRGFISGIEDVIVAELKSYLDAKIMNNYGASWKEVTRYFKGIGVGPIADMDTDDEVSKYLRKVVKGYRSLFKSDGGFVFSLKPSSEIERSSIASNFGKPVTDVDMKKLYAGIRLILESGVIGRINIKNDLL